MDNKIQHIECQCADCVERRERERRLSIFVNDVMSDGKILLVRGERPEDGEDG